MPGVKVEQKSVKLQNLKKGFYQGLLHKLFLPMDQGRLTVYLPNGEELIYGKGGGVEALINVHSEDFFKKCVLFGDVGFGEAYVDGDWSTNDITKVIEWMIVNVEKHPTLVADKKRKVPVNFLKIINRIQHSLRGNTLNGSRKNIQAHYDLGNEFFKLFLDPTMTYSSAYFKNFNEGLEDAQRNKYDALCYKLRLNPSDHVLEIGSGWGGFALHAAKNYGAKITAITISEEQFKYVGHKIKEENLAHKIDVHLSDYRHVRGEFDKVASIEMIEAVGHKFLKTYFAQCHRLLKKQGLLGLQMILSPDHRYKNFRKNTDWIQKHIFPGSLLPSMAAVHRAVNETGTLNLFHYEDMTESYVKTLALWKDRFNQRLDEVKVLGFDEEFVRKWNYYWSYCEAAFKTRNISVVQAVFSRPNNFNLNIHV